MHTEPVTEMDLTLDTIGAIPTADAKVRRVPGTPAMISAMLDIGNRGLRAEIRIGRTRLHLSCSRNAPAVWRKRADRL